jgi:hypothetical protein
MLEIVGFEGHTDAATEVAFGSAVCRASGVTPLRVAGTETFFKPEQWAGLVVKGSATAITPPMPVPDAVLRYTACIMRLRHGTQPYKLIGPRTKISGSGVMSRHEPPEAEFSYYLFVSPTAMEKFCRGIAARLMSDSCGPDKAVADEMKRIAKLFDSKIK